MVDHLGIVFVEPFLDVVMVRVLGIGDSVEHLIEAGDAAAILGRGVPFAADIAGIGDAGLAGADAAVMILIYTYSCLIPCSPTENSTGTEFL